jgi:hypothetical protein
MAEKKIGEVVKKFRKTFKIQYSTHPSNGINFYV